MAGYLPYPDCVKLWVVDVLKARPLPTHDGLFEFRGTNIKTVSVCGVVTHCRHFGTRTNFKLDDCTGEIDCTVNYDKLYKPELGANCDDGELSQVLCTLSRVANERTNIQGDIKLGAVLQASGYLVDRFEGRQINAFSISNPLSVADEMSRRAETSLLYKRIYPAEGDH